MVNIPLNLDIGSYWVARSIMNHETEVIYSVSNITRLQAYAWKIKGTRKMHTIYMEASNMIYSYYKKACTLSYAM